MEAPLSAELVSTEEEGEVFMSVAAAVSERLEGLTLGQIRCLDKFS